MNIIKNAYDRLKGELENYPEKKWIYRPILRYSELLLDRIKENKPVVWYSFAVTPEIFHAFEIASILDVHLAITSPPGGLNKYIDIAEEYGVPEYMCSLNKSVVGAALAGDVPPPDMIIHSSSPCDSGILAYQIVADQYDVPVFCLDMPYWNDERSIEYFTEEVGRMVSFLEDKTGRKLDPDKLKQVMEYSNRTHDYVLRINELKRAVPTPLSTRITSLTAISVMEMAGTPELVDYCKKLYEMTKERVKRKEGAVPDEKIRMVWTCTLIPFDMGIFDWLEREYGAVCIMHLFGRYVYRPVENLSMESMLEGLARKMMDYPMIRQVRGTVEQYIDDVIDACREYKADCAVFAGHLACKAMWASVKLLRDRVYDELGIPTFYFDVDIFDPRVAPSEEIKAKLGKFLSALQ